MAESPLYSFQFLGSANVSLPGYASVTLQWPLPLLLSLGSILVYAALVCPQPQPTPPGAAKTHHAQLCIYSTLTFLACAAYLVLTPAEHTLEGFACNPTPTWFRVMSLVFLASKAWEWRDTWILRGQKSLYDIGFLHVFHHATTMLVWLAALNFPGGEKASYLNAAVHSIMYYHFAYKLPKFVRPFITAFQILQFLTSIISYAHTVTHPCNQDRGGVLEKSIPFVLVGVYLLYFVRFFITSYVFPKLKTM